MELFRVMTTDDEWKAPPNYLIEATSRWSLPGVECPVCDETWASVATRYPAVDLSPLPNVKQYERRGVVPLDEWNRLRDEVQSVVPPATQLVPGTRFGPLVGTARGKIGDFAWISKWILLLQRKTLSQLESAGIRSLVTVPAELTTKGKPVPDLLEIQIEPGAWLVDGERKLKPCSGCGRRGFSKPKNRPLVIDRATVPADRCLFRLQDLPTHIIATQEFRDAVAYFEFSNIEFEDIEVS